MKHVLLLPAGCYCTSGKQKAHRFDQNKGRTTVNSSNKKEACALARAPYLDPASLPLRAGREKKVEGGGIRRETTAPPPILLASFSSIPETWWGKCRRRFLMTFPYGNAFQRNKIHGTWWGKICTLQAAVTALIWFWLTVCFGSWQLPSSSGEGSRSSVC